MADLVPSQNIVTAAADPREVEYVIESSDGTQRREWRKPAPDVEQLKVRILEVLAAEGKELLTLNAAMYAADKSDRIAAVRVALRDRRAKQVIASYAGLKAVAVALQSRGGRRRVGRHRRGHDHGRHAGPHLRTGTVHDARAQPDHIDRQGGRLGHAGRNDHARAVVVVQRPDLGLRHRADRRAAGRRRRLRVVRGRARPRSTISNTARRGAAKRPRPSSAASCRRPTSPPSSNNSRHEIQAKMHLNPHAGKIACLMTNDECTKHERSPNDE